MAAQRARSEPAGASSLPPVGSAVPSVSTQREQLDPEGLSGAPSCGLTTEEEEAKVARLQAERQAHDGMASGSAAGAGRLDTTSLPPEHQPQCSPHSGPTEDMSLSGDDPEHRDPAGVFPVASTPEGDAYTPMLEITVSSSSLLWGSYLLGTYSAASTSMLAIIRTSSLQWHLVMVGAHPVVPTSQCPRSRYPWRLQWLPGSTMSCALRFPLPCEMCRAQWSRGVRAVCAR